MVLWRLVTSAAMFACFVTASRASLITYEFTSDLMSGPLSGTQFSGRFSYDSSSGTGTGHEFLPLTSLDFTIGGVQFDKSDLHQGGQVITDEGRASFFTGAFFPPPPDHSPVNAVAFGFGGPGIIGYVGRDGTPGAGKYVLTGVPEPQIALILLMGCSLLVALRKRDDV